MCTVLRRADPWRTANIGRSLGRFAFWRAWAATRALALTAAVALAPAVARADALPKAAARPPASSGATKPSPPTDALVTFDRDGVRMKVWLQALPGAESHALRQGGRARLRVEMRSVHDNSPLAGVEPAAWLDRLDAEKLDDAGCSRRIAGFVSGGLTERPWRDLSSYHVLLLNADSGISVLDPLTNFAGKTSLRTVLPLPAAGFDWDLHPRQHQLYVGMPDVQQLAIADLASLDAPALIKVPGSPGRVRVHPRGHQVWIGVPQARIQRTNTGVSPGEGGVFIVATADPQRSQWVATGNGHHEIAFDPDGLAAVTNRDSASVAFVDPLNASVMRRESIDGVPLAVVFDPVARAFVVADAKTGALHRFDHTGRPLGEALKLEPGLGPMALSTDRRWLLVLNPAADGLFVIDLPRWSVAHRIAVAGRPFQIVASSQYAYVRTLDREDVAMIHTPSLDAGEPRLQRFVAGEKRPGDVPDLPLALQMSVLPNDNGIFALSPGDATVYTYMQGMNAPMSSASPRGHALRAVMVARHGLLEVERGVYEAEVMLPSTPRAIVALATNEPKTRHCASVALAPALQAPDAKAPMRLVWRIDDSPPRRAAPAIEAVFDGDRATEWPEHLMLWVFAPGGGKQLLEATRQPVRNSDDGRVRAIYRADTETLAPGAYYVHAHSAGHSIVSPRLAQQYASFVVEGGR